MTEQKIRRVNSIIILRDVEVDLEKVNQLFAPLPEKIPVRCKPGVCEFNLNGEIEQLINKVGRLEAVDLGYCECDVEDVRYLRRGKCDIDDIRYCDIYETTDYRYGTVEWLANEPFRHGHDCRFVLWP